MNKVEILKVNEESLIRCKELCNALMQYQAEKSHLHPEILAEMNFENRLQPSFLSAENKLLLLAEYQGKPIGYGYANTYNINEEGRYYLPDWLADIYQEGQLIFYPKKQRLPATIGVFNNLYVKPEFHGKGIGLKLSTQLMEWLKKSDAQDLYVYISNGNEKVIEPFYKKLGFHYSHAVLDGFILAYKQSNGIQ